MHSKEIQDDLTAAGDTPAGTLCVCVHDDVCFFFNAVAPAPYPPEVIEIEPRGLVMVLHTHESTGWLPGGRFIKGKLFLDMQTLKTFWCASGSLEKFFCLIMTERTADE